MTSRRNTSHCTGTHAISEYDLSPSFNGNGSKVPIHPLNLALDPLLDSKDPSLLDGKMFHVMNKGLGGNKRQ